MEKVLNNCVIEYSDLDNEYIDLISETLLNEMKEVNSFFGLKNNSDPFKIKIWGDLSDFRDYYIKIFNRTPKDWVCGFVVNGNVQVLSINKHRKTLNHENDNYDKLTKIIIHEYVHSAHNKVTNINKLPKWVSEGIACYLSKQYNDVELETSLDNIVNGDCAYPNYYAMMNGVMNNSDEGYIKKILTDPEFASSETEKIYNNLKTDCFKK